MTMRSQMAADLSGLFKNEMTVKATYQGANYTVLMDDNQSAEADAFGGPELTDTQRLHFQTVELPSIELGATLTIAEPLPSDPNKFTQTKKIVTGSTTSADGGELIVTIRGA